MKPHYSIESLFGLKRKIPRERDLSDCKNYARFLAAVRFLAAFLTAFFATFLTVFFTARFFVAMVVVN